MNEILTLLKNLLNKPALNLARITKKYLSLFVTRLKKTKLQLMRALLLNTWQKKFVMVITQVNICMNYFHMVICSKIVGMKHPREWSTG